MFTLVFIGLMALVMEAKRLKIFMVTAAFVAVQVVWQSVLMGRSGYQQRSAWDLVQLRAWTRPMEKMSHRSKSPIWHYTAERQAEFCYIRRQLSDCNLS